MILKIDSLIINKYPDLRVGIVRGLGIDNATIPPELSKLKIDSVENFRKRLTLEELALDPHIISWRQTYKAFGVKPKDHRPTAEALARRILKGDDLPGISPVVDLYMLNELDNLLPVGGYDLDRVSGDICLEVSKGDEKFLPIGATEIELTKKDEVVYRDNSGILTRRWNYRDSDLAKITQATQNFVLFIEAALPQISGQALEKATKQLEQSIKKLKHTEIESCIFEPAKHGYTCEI